MEHRGEVSFTWSHARQDKKYVARVFHGGEIFTLTSYMALVVILSLVLPR